MTVFIKNHSFFHFFSYSTSDIKDDTHETIVWMLHKINQYAKVHFKQTNDFTVGICRLEQVV